MNEYVPAALKKLVRERAEGRCEYCLLQEEDSMFPHQLEHVRARKHRGVSVEDNLAWACLICNEFKGTDLASIDMRKAGRSFQPTQG